jgi:hypothetical protein
MIATILPSPQKRNIKKFFEVLLQKNIFNAILLRAGRQALKLRRYQRPGIRFYKIYIAP